MLRTLYFAGALIMAAIGMLGTFAGFVYVIYHISAGGLTLHEAMHQGTAVGMIVSSVSMIGWILFSYLFVREDDRLENEP